MAATQCSTHVDRSCLGGTLRGNLLKFYLTNTNSSAITSHLKTMDFIESLVACWRPVVKIWVPALNI